MDIILRTEYNNIILNNCSERVKEMIFKNYKPELKIYKKQRQNKPYYIKSRY